MKRRQRSNCPAIDVSGLDAWEHIIKTTFDPENITTVSPSKRKQQSKHEIAERKKIDNMTMHNRKIVVNVKEAINKLSSKGIFCCSELHFGTRCMCAYSTKLGLERHQTKGDHKFPTPDLKSWVNDLHLSGKFAFTLATGA